MAIFDNLKRLFSSDVIIRNVGGDELKILDTNNIQTTGVLATNSVVDRFSRIYTTSGISAYAGQMAINYPSLRPQLYSDYESMDTDAIVSSALDIIADECTLRNESGEMLHIRSSDENIQKILYNLFYDVLNIEFNLWSWTRNMCKYGDFFLKLEIAEKFGVYQVIPFSAFNILREEGMDPKNPSYVRFRFDAAAAAGYGTTAGGWANYAAGGSQKSEDAFYFENYEMAHFRLLSDLNYLPYGRSYLEPARKLFKQYILMEDAMLIHRITRAPDRRLFYINIGSIPPAEVENYMQKMVSKLKKTPFMDEKTGQYNLKYNVMNMLEDYYIPVRGNDTTTKIDSVKGLEYDGIKDVEYLREKLFAALKVPKAFMGYEKDLTGKATLAAEDIRFARTIERIQRILVSELTKIALVHLYTQGYDGEAMTNFELSLTTPSIIYDQERIALLKEKVELAKSIQESGLMPTDWIYDNVFHFSEDEIDEYRDLVIEDKKRQFRYKQVEEEGNDPAETGQAYGTPHQLATIYGKGRYTQVPNAPTDIPMGYDENEPNIVRLPGRPQEKTSIKDTQQSPFGKDALGRKEYSSSDDGEDKYGKTNHKGGSPLALESKAQYYKNKFMFDMMPKPESRKIHLFENKDDDGILSEDNIMPL
jgi:hypothetical protein